MEGRKRNLYLLWAGIQGWGLFTETDCPDRGAFPEYMYKKYTVDEKNYHNAWNILFKHLGDLWKNKIEPTRDNYSEIFPDIDDEL